MSYTKEALTEVEKVPVVLETSLSHNKVDDVVQLAHEVEATRDSPWTFSMWRLYAVLWIAYLCGCLNGFDGSLMGGINAMTSYQKAFGL